jgi:hypothetical protein
LHDKIAYWLGKKQSAELCNYQVTKESIRIWKADNYYSQREKIVSFLQSSYLSKESIPKLIEENKNALKEDE